MCLLVCFDVAKIVLFAYTTNKNMLNNILFLDILMKIKVFLLSYTNANDFFFFPVVFIGLKDKQNPLF